MASDQQVEEMAHWLQRLRDYASGDAFAAERRLACQELLSQQPGTVAEAAAVDELLASTVGQSDWFLFQRRHSRLARTPVRLFVERTPELPAHVADRLLACEQPDTNLYAVVSASEGAVVVNSLHDAAGDYYRVRVSADQAWIVAGLTVAAALERRDGEYWFLGQPRRWPETVSDVVELSEAVRQSRGPREWSAPLSRGDWVRRKRQRR